MAPEAISRLGRHFQTRSPRVWRGIAHPHLQYDTPAINMLNSRSRSLNRIKTLNGLYDLTSIHIFENVPYLRRFRINGTYIITSSVRFNCAVLLTIVLNLLKSGTISQSRRMTVLKIYLTISPLTPCSLMGIRSYVFTSMIKSHLSIARGTTRFSRATTPLRSRSMLQPSASNSCGTSQQ